jgi:hypothetical protein
MADVSNIDQAFAGGNWGRCSRNSATTGSGAGLSAGKFRDKKQTNQFTPIEHILHSFIVAKSLHITPRSFLYQY